MSKKKKVKKGVTGKSIQEIPCIGFQTAHFKAKSRLQTAAQGDVQREQPLQRRPVDAGGRLPVADLLALPRLPPPTSSGALAMPGASIGRAFLPPGIHCRTTQFTSRNYSSNRPCGLPQLPGLCVVCGDYMFDLTPHYWSFHEIDLPLAQQLARSGCA